MRDLVRAKIRRIINHPARGYENTIKTASGDQRVFTWNSNSLADERGHVIGVVVVGLEITARKQAEEEVLKLNAELEERVALRTRELEAANTELEAFTSMVSHDLRAPLRRIRSYLRLMSESTSGALNKESQSHMDRILDGAAKMDSLVSDLLTFSRAARIEISCAPIDLSKLVGEIQQELRLEWEQRSVVWEIEEVPVVQGDRALLHQVLINLLSNALKYSKTRP